MINPNPYNLLGHGKQDCQMHFFCDSVKYFFLDTGGGCWQWRPRPCCVGEIADACCYGPESTNMSPAMIPTFCAYLPWYPPCLVPTWCLLLWFIRSVPHHPACSRLLYANLCPIYAAVLNIYAAVFSAINSKSIWRQNGWRMSWQGRLYKWILFCLEVLARIGATRAPCLAGR